MSGPSEEYVTADHRYILKPGDLEKLKDGIKDALDDLGIDYFYYEARGGVHVIEDRKRRGI